MHGQFLKAFEVKLFKIADCLIQFLLLAAGLLFLLMTGFEMPFVAYFGIGLWQLLSIIVHLVFTKYNIKPLRRIYEFTLLFLKLMYLLVYLLPDSISALAILLLYASPLMASYYCVVCCKETLKLT